MRKPQPKRKPLDLAKVAGGIKSIGGGDISADALAKVTGGWIEFKPGDSIWA